LSEIYWITPQVAISAAIAESDILDLKVSGIDAIVDMRSEYSDNVEAVKRAGLSFLHVGVNDRCNPSGEQLEEIFDFISPLLDEGRNVLIHCQNGAGRSPLVATALLSKRGMSLSEAARLVKDKNPKTGFSEEQERFISIDLEEILRDGSHDLE